MTVFYGSGYTALKSDLNGGFTGRIPSETPQDEGAFTAPALVCAEKHGILTVKLTPFTITTLEDADEGSVEEVRLSEAGDWHQVTFFTGTSLPAVLQREGDVLQLTLSPCQTAPVFSDEAFAAVDVQQQGNTARYRLVLPDDGQNRQFQLLWEPEKITFRVRRTPPDPSEADR